LGEGSVEVIAVGKEPIGRALEMIARDGEGAGDACAAGGAGGVAGGVGAYFLAPHVASRIDRFMSPDQGDTFQVNTALNAFVHGGITGVGPGEGSVKFVLPELNSHATNVHVFGGVQFQKHGIYHVEIQIDGELRMRFPLPVVPVQQQGQAPG
jgi:hypothetical protein